MANLNTQQMPNANSSRGAVKEGAQELGSDALRMLENAQEFAVEKLKTTTDKGQKYFREMASSGSQLIKSRPFAAVVTTLGVGVVIGSLLRRKIS